MEKGSKILTVKKSVSNTTDLSSITHSPTGIDPAPSSLFTKFDDTVSILHSNGGYYGYDALEGNDKVELYGNKYVTVNISGNLGDDYISAAGQDLTLNASGDLGNDFLIGGNTKDSLIGDGKFETKYDGSDVIEGRGGDDYISGGGGIDILYGQEGSDEVYGGSGDDYILGDDKFSKLTDGADQLYGGDGDDFIFGGGGDDIIKGQEGSDKLYGGNGNDFLDGSNGGDTLNGGLDGNDTLIGGDGKDIFQFDLTSDMNVLPANHMDTVKDFGITKDYLDVVDPSSVVITDSGNSGGQFFVTLGLKMDSGVVEDMVTLWTGADQVTDISQIPMI